MSADRTQQVLGTAEYLNAGNYGQALGAYRVIQQQQHQSAYVLASPNWGYNGFETPRVLGAFLGDQERFVAADPQTIDQMVRIINEGRAPGTPTTPPGSRRASGFEDAQTDALINARPAATEQLTLARELVNAARESGSSQFIARAQQMEAEARREFDRLNGAIIVSDTYHGRAFASDAEALRYVDLRDAALRTVMENARFDQVEHQEAFSTRSLALLADMRAAFDGTNRNLGGPVNMLSAETIQRVRNGVTQSRAANSVASDLVAASGANNFFGGDLAIDQGWVAEYFQRTASQSSQFGDNRPNSRIDDLTAGRARGSDTLETPSTRSSSDRAAVSGANDGGQPNRQPTPVPTSERYPTVSAEERARISREAATRRREREAAAAGASAAERVQQEAAARETAERAAMVERSRIADENYRIYQAAVRQAAQDGRWRQMVEARFAPNASIVDRNYAYAEGQSIRMANLERIYGASNYRDGNVARSLSAAGTGPSSLGNSMSSAGMSLSSVGLSLSSAGTDWRDPALESLHDAMGYFNYRSRSNPWQSGMDGDPARAAQMAYNAGSFDVRFNRDGREGRESGGYLAANLFTFDDPYLRLLTANGFTGLDSLLAQPFNVVLTWGQGAYDLDLHMTGPLGETTSNRFHIYYSATGNLEAQPFAALIKDCICNAGSEVILTSALNRGGVYRVSVFNFGDQSATSTNLSGASQAQIQIVRGGTTQSVGNGTTIVGGRVILSTTVPTSGAGNTWVAAELDPRNGRITVPGRITQSPGSGGVE